MPRPFQTPLVLPPVLRPTSSGIDPLDGAPVNHHTETEVAAILPRLKTSILGYDGVFPGPNISVEQGSKTVLFCHQCRTKCVPHPRVRIVITSRHSSSLHS